MKILVANGVNLDLLGEREVEHYGRFNLSDLETHLQGEAKKLSSWFSLSDLQLAFFQTNDQAAFLEALTGKDYDGLLINPAAWTHTSLALADRLAALDKPYVEVHISNLAQREPLRQKSLTAKHAAGVVYGFGMYSYVTGLLGLLNKLVGSPS